MFCRAGNKYIPERKRSRPNFLFRERTFLFRDRTVVRPSVARSDSPDRVPSFYIVLLVRVPFLTRIVVSLRFHNWMFLVLTCSLQKTWATSEEDRFDVLRCVVIQWRGDVNGSVTFYCCQIWPRVFSVCNAECTVMHSNCILIYCRAIFRNWYSSMISNMENGVIKQLLLNQILFCSIY